jgi:AcrR family transcriptional regulator
MGRKPTSKARKSDPTKTDAWLEALLPKLQSVDLQALTMDDIADLIGKSKSTVYEYFPSKETLLLEGVQIRLRALSRLRKMIDFTEGEVTILYINYITLIANVVADISISFLEAIEQGFPKIWKEILASMQSIIDDLTLLYQIGIERQDFKKVSAEWLIELDRFFVTQIINDAKLWSHKPITLDQLIKEYLDIRLHGLLKT